MTNFPSWKKIGIKNGYKQMMTVIAFLTFTVLLMFPPQNVYAHDNTPPSVQITTSAPTVTQNGQVPITTGTTVSVRFNFRGTDTDDLLQEFRCSWDGAPYAVSQCIGITSGQNGITSGQNTNSMNGYARKDLPAGSHTFGVKVVNNHRVDQHNPPDQNGPQRISVPVAPSSLRSFTVIAPIAPSVTITGAAATGPISNGETRELPPGHTEMPVTFYYRGTIDAGQSPISGFRCVWTTGGAAIKTNSMYPPDSCPNMSIESNVVTTGSASRMLGPGSYSFGVQAYNSLIPPTFRSSAPWTVTITQAPTPTTEICGDGIDNNRNGQIDEEPCPRVRIHVHDANGMDVSFRRTSYGVFFTLYEVRGEMLDRYCDTGLLSGPIPSKIVYDRQRFSTCVTIPDRALQGEVGWGLNHLHSLVNPGTYSYCAVVFDTSNRRSSVSCTQWEVIRGSNPDISPTTRLSDVRSGGIYIGTWETLPNGGRTPYHGINFIARAVPPAGVGGSDQEAYFDCAWDSGWFSKCGFRVDAQTTFIPLSGVGDGAHYVRVKAWYPGSSSIGPGESFNWCVVSPTSPCGPGITTIRNPIYRGMSLTGMFPVGSGINESSIINDAGLNKIVVENEKANLSSTIIKVDAGIPDNKTKADIKSLLWKQIEGPMVKLNSTDTQAVEFVAPSVKNDTLLKFDFTITDQRLKATDTISVLLVTKENAQKYKGNFCDAMVIKALEYISNAKNTTADGKLKNDNKSPQANMELARKYLGECQGSLNQYSNQLGNMTEIFPDFNVTTSANNQTLFLKDLKEFPLINETIGAKNAFQNKTIGTNTTNVTSFILKETTTTVNKTGNESIVKDK